MKAKITRHVGLDVWEFEINEEKQIPFFEQAAFITSLPSKCGHCGEKNLRFMHRMPQGYNYYSVACLDCQWELDYGEKLEKNGGGLFCKKWREPYKANDPYYHTDPNPNPYATQSVKPTIQPMVKKEGESDFAPSEYDFDHIDEGITDRQRKYLFAYAKQELGYNETDLKNHMSSLFGKAIMDDKGNPTTKKLTYVMFNELINSLKKEAGK